MYTARSCSINFINYLHSLSPTTLGKLNRISALSTIAVVLLLNLQFIDQVSVIASPDLDTNHCCSLQDVYPGLYDHVFSKTLFPKELLYPGDSQVTKFMHMALTILLRQRFIAICYHIYPRIRDI